MPAYDPLLRGFSDLSSALLLAPQQARQRRIEEEDKALARQDRDRALQQALMFHNQSREDQLAEREAQKAYRQQQIDADKMKFATEGERYKSSQERLQQQDARQAALDKEAERQRTFGMAKDTADQGRRTLDFYEGKRHNKALEEATRGKIETKAPEIKNFGNDDSPDWRERDPKTGVWKPAALADALGVPGKAAGTTPATNQAMADAFLKSQGVPKGGYPTGGSGGSSIMSLRRSGVAGAPSTLGDVLGGRWSGAGEQVQEQAPDQKLADLPRFQQAGMEYAAKLPPEQQQHYIGVRNELLNRWAQAVQAGDTELEGRIARIIEEQNQAVGQATGIPP